MLKRLFKTIIYTFIASILTLAFCLYTFNNWLNHPLNLGAETVVRINAGDTLSKLSYQLAKDNILTHPRGLILYAKLTKQTGVEVGEYKLPTQITPKLLLETLRYGDVVSYKVTLVEGKTFKDFMFVLSEQEQLESTLKNKNFDDIKKQLELNIDHPEGWFYPDTYQYVAGSSDADILLRAHTRMKKVLDEEWLKRAEALPYKNAYEALIMASIIEKETGVAYERPEISGVFVRRLNKGMRLQTDPTIIYGLGDSYKGNIRRKHLTQKTPYNTYVINGLPPTPIAMPARAAINAALNPAKGKTLFFVAKGDGSHQFSETLAQHNKAVQEYQIKNKAKNYRSSPAK
jgi:UPF0755 protein